MLETSMFHPPVSMRNVGETSRLRQGSEMTMKALAMLALFATASLATLLAKNGCYDPLKTSGEPVVSKTFEVRDTGRDRVLPIRVYFPESEKPAAVILFSHGLGGSCDNNPYLGNHWAGRGYVVVFVQHPGSDEAVWKDVLPPRRMAAMKQAASGENSMNRNKDIPAVIDALARWNADAKHALHGRLDLDHIGMSGHSFGAVTTQSMSGQSAGGGRISFLEPRISAAVMMSPSIPRMGGPAEAFASVRIPCLLMTGTLDSSSIGNSTIEERLKVYPNLTNAPAWQVVFDKATHASFSERDLRGNDMSGSRYHRAILALTTAFWDAQLRGDKEATTWLAGEGARSVLDKADKWEMNEMAVRVSEKK